MIFSCNNEQEGNGKDQTQTIKEVMAKDILGNPDYLAISYGGHREISRDIQPTIEQLKEDMKILAAMGVKVLRTYNTTKFEHASNTLEAIHQLKKEDPSFEMYVMLGAWIDCKNAHTPNPDHNDEDAEGNAAEIQRAIELANQYPDIVKIIAVGNEAMVKWAASYYVQPWVILKWVNHLQHLKQLGELPEDLWITSSDNFASWGGGDPEYHLEDLEKLIKAVDFISLHTYPMHDTHYNPSFWGVSPQEEGLSDLEKIDRAMERSRAYAVSQYQNTANYIKSLGVDKPIHIGETGWASASNSFYGPDGSRATDEYKEALFIRKYGNGQTRRMSPASILKLLTKYGRMPKIQEVLRIILVFSLLTDRLNMLCGICRSRCFRGIRPWGNPITKTYNGKKEDLLEAVLLPPVKDLPILHEKEITE